jgi:succinoglycan biosynthesis transport protein ExoP
VLDEDQAKPDYYQTQYNILQSRALARRTIEDLKLWNTPPFGGGQPTGLSVKQALSSTAAFLGSLMSTNDARPAENLVPGADETAAQSRAIDAFLSNLTVAPIRNSRLVDLKYDLPDAGLATRIVNTLAKSYIEQSLE